MSPEIATIKYGRFGNRFVAVIAVYFRDIPFVHSRQCILKSFGCVFSKRGGEGGREEAEGRREGEREREGGGERGRERGRERVCVEEREGERERERQREREKQGGRDSDRDTEKDKDRDRETDTKRRAPGRSFWLSCFIVLFWSPEFGIIAVLKLCCFLL